MSHAGTPDPSRDALTAAALRVARRDGVASLDPDSVAAEAGVTPEQVLAVFQDAGELVVALVMVVNRRLRRALSVPVTAGGRIEDCLVGGLRGLWLEVEARGGDTVVAIDIAIVGARRDDYRAGAHRQREESAAAVRDFLASAAGSTRSRWLLPVEHLTELTLNALAGASLAFVVDRDARAGRRRLETLGRVLARCAAPLDPPADPGRVGRTGRPAPSPAPPGRAGQPGQSGQAGRASADEDPAA